MSFSYNIWGQPTTTKVGNRTLSTNSYYDYDGETDGVGGNLKTTTCGNGDSVSYTYDDLDRLVRKQYNNGKYTEYFYNSESALAKLTYGDGSGETASYLFEYDSLGRLVRSSEADANGTVTQRTEHIYDEYSRLKRQSWTVNNQSYSEAYTYNDGTNETGNLATMTTGTGDVLNFGYDALKRLQKVTVKGGNAPLFSTAYAYRNIDSTRTTPQVEFRNVRIGDSGTILEGKKYVYDELGNIKEIRQSTSPYNLLIAYEYDAQNQLTSEIHYNGSGEATANITAAYYYDYDAAGNLLKVEKGTVNSAGTLTKTTEQTYTYSDTDWHDLLTAANGSPITYDASGNPEYYNGWNFDWQRGRELASAEQNDGTTDTTLTYAYDADGIRTGKTYTKAVYEPLRCTVTFVANDTTLKTMTVEYGYILQDSDYPELPEVVGAAGSWPKRTSPVQADITIKAKYVAMIPHYVTFMADAKRVSVLEVVDGYVLKDSDYPAVPAKRGYTGHWEKYTSPIRSDITIQAKYKKDASLPIQPTRPSGGVMSEDLPEPIEPQDVAKPEDTANTSENTADPLSSRPGQTLVSTQTVTHEYLTLSGKVVRETIKTNNSLTAVMDFIYDESGRPFALNYSTNGGNTFTTYYYILNLQGDVVKLVASSGSVVASYEYDAWGNILSQSGTMADKNPLRYRGYYYDTETGFYYLQSRYYDPTLRRFINADAYASTGQGFVGTNMFAYCNNNPVIYMDDAGKSVSTVVEEYSYDYYYGEYLVTISVSVTASAGWGEHASVTFVENKPSLSISITDKDLKQIDYYLENKIYPSLKEKHTTEEKSSTSFGMSFGLAQYTFDVQQEIDEHFSLNISVSVTSLSTLHAIGRAFGGLKGNISTGMGQNTALGSSGGVYLEYTFGGNLLSRLSYFFI